MPYNVDKKDGGDSKENTNWMERCKKKVMSSGKDESSAIAICKAQLSKKKSSVDEAEIEIDAEVLVNYETYRRKWILREMQKYQVPFQKAASHFEIYLTLNNYILDI